MAKSNAEIRAAVRTAEARISRYRGEDNRDDAARNEGREEDRADITSLLVAAHEAATSLEDDLETLRECLSPVMDAVGVVSEDVMDSDDSIAPAIKKLEHLVKRISDAGRAVRFLTRSARI